MASNLKTCSRAKKDLCPNTNPQALENFSANPSKKDSLQYHCKDCQKIISDQHYINNKKKYKRRKNQQTAAIKAVRKARKLTKCESKDWTKPCRRHMTCWINSPEHYNCYFVWVHFWDGAPMTYDQIAPLFDVTHQSIQNIERAALEKLQKITSPSYDTN